MTRLIDGNIFPKAAGKGGFRIITPTASKREVGRTDISLGCREITDVDARLADMDKAGVSIQVIYPTLFLIQVTDDVERVPGVTHWARSRHGHERNTGTSAR